MSQPQHLLLVHPDERNRRIIKRALAERGFDKVAESSGDHDCIKLLNEVSFDIIVMCIELGDLDAWQITRLVRSGVLTTKGNTPVFIVSETFSEQIALATAKEFEVNGFISIDQAHTLPRAIERMYESGNTEPPKSTILIVEDYPDTIKLAERILKNRFTIETAMDGEAGLNAWKEGRHEIVLLDLMLPKMSGEEVLREILKIKPTQSVVMMTAFGSAEKAGALISAGAVDFISKPFRADQLRHVCNIAAHREDYIISNRQFEERQQELNAERELALVTLNSIGDGVITTNASGAVTSMNPIAEMITGWLSSEAESLPIDDVFKTYHEYTRVPAVTPVVRCLEEKRSIRGKSNLLLRSKQGEEVILEVSASPIRNGDGEITGAVMVFKDSTAARNLEKQLTFHASHDSVTGLKNRQVFDQEVQLAISDCISPQAHHVLCHLDINEFRMVNESRGSQAGDKLLKEVARLVGSRVRNPSDSISRIGGHEFAFLLKHCPLEAAQRICNEIIGDFEGFKFTWEGAEYDISIGIGLTNINQENKDPLDIFTTAKAACITAQESGSNRMHYASADEDGTAKKRGEVQLASEILQAKKEERFTLFCQTIKSLKDPTDLSYEILIRMIDEDGKIVSPAAFLPAAERYNLMPQVDRWVVENTFEWLHNNPEKLKRITHFSVNLSGVSLSDEQMYDDIRKLFERFDVPPEKICFEITETAAVKNYGIAQKFISDIRDLGCEFSLDDFGSGMSSFAYLKNMRVDYLKIDGMFVKDILTDDWDRAMVSSINDIGHVSGLRTIAEFVENEEIEAKLKEIGIDYVQGYGISKPMPLDEMEF